MRLLRLNRNGLASSLGPLEAHIMDVLWAEHAPLSVADVRSKLRTEDLAYSTVKAVLNNLAEKSHVVKSSAGKSNLFTAATSKSEFDSKVVSTVLKSLLHSYREPVIAHLVDELNSDSEMLDQLERMIKQKRSSRRAK